MKFALKVALTVGTLDGANIEIRDHVGEDNIVIFGKTAEEVVAARNGGPSPREIIETAPELKQALDAIAGGVFSPDDHNRYKDLIGSLYNSDWFMVARDFEAYFDAQRDIDKLWTNNKEWYAKTIRNTANMAWFSSDRTIREYAKDIWQVQASEV
jgi:starch phosphorylase